MTVMCGFECESNSCESTSSIEKHCVLCYALLGGLTVEKDSKFSGLSSSVQVIQTQGYLSIFKARAL